MILLWWHISSESRHSSEIKIYIHIFRFNICLGLTIRMKSLSSQLFIDVCTVLFWRETLSADDDIENDGAVVVNNTQVHHSYDDNVVVVQEFISILF